MSSVKSRFTVRLQPRASRDEVLDWNDEGALRVRVKAAPVDRAANKALIQLMSKLLDVPRKHMDIVSGTAARTKVIEVEGVSSAELRSRLIRQ